MESLLPVLVPFVSVTEILGTEDYPTCSAVLPLTMGLINNHLVPDEMDPGVITDFRENVCNGLRSWVIVGEYRLSTPAIAAVLDPRYKRPKFFWEAQSAQLSKKTTNMLESSSWDEAEPSMDRNEDTAAIQLKKEHDCSQEAKSSSNETAMQFLLGDLIEVGSNDEQQFPAAEYKAFRAEAAARRLRIYPRMVGGK